MNKPLSPYQAAYGLLTNSQGKFLLVKRSVDDTFPGMWEFPGGSVEKGESLLEATKREVEEETGVTVRVGEELVREDGTSGNGRHVTRYAFLCHMLEPDQQIVLNPEHDAYQWVSFTDPLPEYVSGLVKKVWQQRSEKAGD